MQITTRHFLGAGTTITYPHCNGFVSDGAHMIYRQALPTGEGQLHNLDLRTLKTAPLPPLPRSHGPDGKAGVSYDVATNALRLAALSRHAAWTLDLAEPGANWRQIYTSPAGSTLQDLPSISPDGRKLLVGETRVNSATGANTCAAVEIDHETLHTRTLFEHSWHANHFHYCPHDPAWVGYSHEGPTEKTLDRCWAWHARHAPEGRCVFDQHAAAENPALPLNAGHERWSYHDTSAYVIAYAVSPGGKRGLWEIFAAPDPTQTRPPRLLRESNTAWHCNMDTTGRIAVIDTSAPWDSDPATGAAYDNGVAAHLQADRDRTPNTSDVVLLDLKTGADLLVATVTRTRHPWHPHPALSPDARWLVYNDANPARQGAWLVRLQQR